uniref:Uncharacterized protein n=1 Tax=Alexandrium monilatum TaxID=311494 RepID=A0A7S4RN11_9DINO
MTNSKREKPENQKKAKDKKEKKEKEKKAKDKWDSAEWADAWQSSKEGDAVDLWNEVKLPDADTSYALDEKGEGDEEEEDGGDCLFWDELDSLAAGPRTRRGAAGTWDGKSQGGASVLQVPPNRIAEVSRRQERLALVSGAELELSGSVLRISGPTEGRSRAERYARAVITERSDADEHPDITLVPLLAEWAERWRGNESRFEGTGGALVMIESPVAQMASRYTVHQAIEVRWGSAGTWHMATVLGRPAPTRLRVRWCCDGSTEEVDLSRTRPSWQAVIFGPLKDRLATEVSVMVAFEDFAKGTIAARMEVARPCSGIGLEYIDLNIQPNMVPRTMHRLRQSVALKHLVRASGSLKLELFVFPKWSATADRGDAGCALLAGTREQRWQASQFLVAFAAVQEGKAVTFLPPHLAGECRIVGVPIGMMAAFIGSKQSNIGKLMEDTGTFVFNMRERRGRPGKREHDDKTDMLEMMLDQLREGPAGEIVIIGPARAQFSAEIKIRAQIEERYHGYFKAESRSDIEMVDPVEGLGIDMEWLTGDFEDSASRTQAEILSGAANCLVESAGRLVFLAGKRHERVRAHEYLKYITSRRLGKKLTVPYVESRSDAIQLRIPKEVLKSSWLTERLAELSIDSKIAAFIDSWQCPSGWGRIVVLGEMLEQRTDSDTEVFERVKNLVEQTYTWSRRGSSSTAGLVGMWWRVDGDTRLRGSGGSTAGDAPDTDPASGAAPEGCAEGAVAEPGSEPMDAADEGPLYSSEVLAAAPSTPVLDVGVAKVALAVPCTPAPGTSYGAPMSPVDDGGAAPVGNRWPPQPPGGSVDKTAPRRTDSVQEGFRGAPPPKYAMVGHSDEPPTKRFRGAPPPKAAVVGAPPKPKAPAAPRPQAVTQAKKPEGIPLPSTPAAVPAPRTPAPSAPPPAAARVEAAADVPMPSTPAAVARPAGVAAPMPQTPRTSAPPPAAARIDPAEDAASGAAPPRVEAVPSARAPAASARPISAALTDPGLELPPDLPSFSMDVDLAPTLPANPVPKTPAALVGSTSAPRTPAAIANRAPGASTSAPQTPAAIAGNRGAAPQTPAFISGSRGFAPQTPAFTSGKSSAPQTPATKAGRLAPGTPAAISSSTRPVPQTPAAIGSAGKSARNAPSTPAAILVAGPPSPTSAPPSRAPMQPPPAAKQGKAPGAKEPPMSKFAPKRAQVGAAEDSKEADAGDEDATAVTLHHGMTYSEWAAAKLAASKD